MESAKPSDVELIVLDVDGVLTPGSVLILDNGSLMYHFNVYDGAGIKYWIRLGGKVAIITGRESRAVKIRARELGIELVYQNAKRKIEAYRDCLEKLQMDPTRVCCVGDDLPDLPLMLNCGYPAAVANAIDEVKRYARFITVREGGNGAVRELVEHLLNAQGKWEDLLDGYLKQKI